MNSRLSVAIVGATGAVGQEFLRLLVERQFPVGDLKLLASIRSAGKTLDFKDKTLTIKELTENSFQNIDLALFSAGGSISKKFAPIASESGATVVDNSSAFRLSEHVPLVIPEVNAHTLKGIEIGQGGIIANPNCSTIIMVVPVTPIHRVARIRRIVVNTYQAASGAGAAAMAELEKQTREILAGQPPTCSIFQQQYAFNLFSHDSKIGPEGYNLEEIKMLRETHKIWEDTSVAITATCVRVPVMRAHAESINLELEHPLEEIEARRLLESAPGVTVLDDRLSNRFPTPLEASGRDSIYVGRIRSDISRKETQGVHGLDLFVCADQIRKGAALNAIQIAELLVRR